MRQKKAKVQGRRASCVLINIYRIPLWLAEIRESFIEKTISRSNTITRKKKERTATIHTKPHTQNKGANQEKRNSLAACGA